MIKNEATTTESNDNYAQNLLRSWYSRSECQLHRYFKQKEASGASCRTSKDSSTFCGFTACPFAHSLSNLSSTNLACNSKNGRHSLKPASSSKSKRRSEKTVQTGNREIRINHNMSVTEILQEYREKFVYSRARLVKAQKQAAVIAQESETRSCKLVKPENKQSGAENSPKKISSPKRTITEKKVKQNRIEKKKSSGKTNPQETKKPKAPRAHKKQMKKGKRTRLPIIMNVVNLESQQLTDPNEDKTSLLCQTKKIEMKKKLNLPITKNAIEKRYSILDMTNADKVVCSNAHEKPGLDDNSTVSIQGSTSYLHPEHAVGSNHLQKYKHLNSFYLSNFHPNSPNSDIDIHRIINKEIPSTPASISNGIPNTNCYEEEEKSEAELNKNSNECSNPHNSECFINESGKSLTSDIKETKISKETHIISNSEVFTEEKTGVDVITKSFKGSPRDDCERDKQTKLKSDQISSGRSIVNVNKIENEDIRLIKVESLEEGNGCLTEPKVPSRPTANKDVAIVTKQQESRTTHFNRVKGKFKLKPFATHKQTLTTSVLSTFPKLDATERKFTQHTSTISNPTIRKTISSNKNEKGGKVLMNFTKNISAGDPPNPNDVNIEIDKYGNSLVSEIRKIKGIIEKKRRERGLADKNVISRKVSSNVNILTSDSASAWKTNYGSSRHSVDISNTTSNVFIQSKSIVDSEESNVATLSHRLSPINEVKSHGSAKYPNIKVNNSNSKVNAGTETLLRSKMVDLILKKTGITNSSKELRKPIAKKEENVGTVSTQSKNMKISPIQRSEYLKFALSKSKTESSGTVKDAMIRHMSEKNGMLDACFNINKSENTQEQLTPNITDAIEMTSMN